MDINYKFIFSPNNSGTTIMGQYLAAHTEASYLPPFGNYEGQMAPNVKKMMRVKPWNPDSFFDWKFIKDEWDTLAKKHKKSTFIECSPPNMLRVAAILETFKNCKYIFSISSPYSYVASNIYNSFGMGKNSNKSNFRFRNAVKNMTKEWIKKASLQRSNIELFGNESIRTTYEDFCSNPNILMSLFGDENSKIRAETSIIKGKGNTRITEVINMLPKHLAFLGVEGISQTNTILADYKDLVKWFGYKILSTNNVNNILSENIFLALDGQRRRISLDNKLRNQSA